MSRFSKAAIVTLLLSVGVFFASSSARHITAQQKGSPNKVSAFMRIKLAHSQQVLEGLTMENYGMIARHSQKLSLLSLESNWKVLQTPEYLRQSISFRDSADRMTKAAREKSLDGATLAYVQMTIQCVNCHKYVRNTQAP